MRTESGKAAGLAVATLVNNAIQLVFTIIFTRMLGKTGYGTLAALISAFLILLVAGQSAQLAAAREAALDRLGHPELLRATLRAWTRRLVLATVVVAAIGTALQQPLATIIGVPEEPWGAAVIPVTGALWMLLSLQRGALQGLRQYGTVGWSIVAESFLRLVFALILVVLGLNVTGALLGLPLAFAVVSLWLERQLHRHVGPVVKPDRPVRTLRSLVGDGWVPIIGLFLLASLQNIDVIVAKHQLSSDAAGSYAAAAVAAKAVVWVAIGIGLHLLPEATRRSAAGLDPRPVLLRALTILAIIATPGAADLRLVPELLLRLAFGPSFVQASGALVLLGLSMTLLAVAYLTVQYMVALGEQRFVWVLGGHRAGRAVPAHRRPRGHRDVRRGRARRPARRGRLHPRDGPDRAAAPADVGRVTFDAAWAHARDVEGWLTEAQGAAPAHRRRGRGAGRPRGRDRLVPRALGDRPGRGRRRRGRVHRPARRLGPRPAGDRGRRRPRRGRRAAPSAPNLQRAGVERPDPPRARVLRRGARRGRRRARRAVRRRRAPLRPRARGHRALGRPRAPRRPDARARLVLLGRRDARAGDDDALPARPLALRGARRLAGRVRAHRRAGLGQHGRAAAPASVVRGQRGAQGADPRPRAQRSLAV